MATPKKQEQGYCPVCGKELENYGTIVPESNSIGYPWQCKKCGSQGTEWYNIEFSEHVVSYNSKKKVKE